MPRPLRDGGLGTTKAIRVLPAATRSSRTELFRDWIHHWPSPEVSRLRSSGSSQWSTSLLSVCMAAILGLLESKNVGKRTSLENVSNQAPRKGVSTGLGGKFWAPPSHIEQLRFEGSIWGQDALGNVLSAKHNPRDKVSSARH